MNCVTDLATLLQDKICGHSDFVSAVFTGRNRAHTENEWKKIIIKPVLLKNDLHYQFNYFDDVKSITKNFSVVDIAQEIKAVSTFGFNSIYIRYFTSRLQIQITKKDKILVRPHKSLEIQITDLTHDKQKHRLIKQDANNFYLNVLGFNDKAGQIKPSMQAKFRQINEFVKIVAQLLSNHAFDKTAHIVDCGTGNAYLAFALYDYFKNTLQHDIRITGIDTDALAIENNKDKATMLGWNQIHFDVSNIIGFRPDTPPTLTMALHACDTATDEALLKALEWQSPFIIAVPCCHHDLQKRLKAISENATFAGSLKHGILRERLGDTLTDTFRALILEIMGYKTEIIQFVSPEHTAKNLLLRAQKISEQPVGNSVAEYKKLKEFWQVTPILEELLVNNSAFQEKVSV